MRSRTLLSAWWLLVLLVGPPWAGMAASPAISLEHAARVAPVGTLVGHTAEVRDVVFSPDGKYLASSAGDGTVRVWDLLTGLEIHSFKRLSGAAHLNSLGFSPDGRLLASAQAVWDVETFSLVRQLGASMNHVAFSPDGTLLALSGEAQRTCLLDTSAWATVQTFPSQLAVDPMGDATFGFEFSPSGALLASGGLSGAVRIWDVATGSLSKTLSYGVGNSGVHDVAFSGDGRLLAAGGTDLWVRIFDVGTGQTVSTLFVEDGTSSLDFSPDGTVLAITWGSSATLWDVQMRRKVRSLPSSARVFSLGFSPDGRLLACGCYDGTIALWGVVE